jgi:TonB family protein
MLLYRLRPLCLAATAAWPMAGALAQPAAPPAPTAAASGASAELTPAERAKRDADKVFHWILIQGDKARKPAAVRDDKADKAEKPDKPIARVKPPVRTPGRPDETAAPRGADAVSGSAPAAAAQAAAPAAPPMGLPEEAPAPAAATVAAPAVDDATEPLTPLAQPEPRFPPTLLRTLRSGQVQVRFTVLPDGSVAEPVVVTSSNPKLNPPALAAVAQWRFAPVRRPQQGIVDLGFNNE